MYQIEKNAEDIRWTVLTNTVKMITARKLIDENKMADALKAIEKESINSTYEIPMKNGEIFMVIYIPQKITAINKSFGINDFLNNNKDRKKIVIIKEISKKANQYITNSSNNSEVFLEEELMRNLIDHECVPKHEILSEELKQDFLKKINAKKKDMPRIFKSDPVARYYNMQIGDICRITRPSEKTGISITYRLVVKGK